MTEPTELSKFPLFDLLAVLLSLIVLGTPAFLSHRQHKEAQHHEPAAEEVRIPSRSAEAAASGSVARDTAVPASDAQPADASVHSGRH